ncbi:MAG: hypothetical protein WCP60_04050 [bacterium]
MKTLLFLIIALIVLSGCSSTNYLSYSGTGIQQGRGGPISRCMGSTSGRRELPTVPSK